MSNKLVKVGFDVDGVLVDNITPFLNAFHLTPPPGWEPSCWYWANTDFGIPTEAVDAFFKGGGCGPGWWQSMPPIQPNVQDLYSFLTHNKHVVPIYITARDGYRADLQTSYWLNYHGIGHSQLIMSPKKGDVARILNLDFYIDDKLENCLDVFDKTGRKPYLLDKSYNRHNTPDEALKFHRVSSLKEMLNDVGNYVHIL